ncbi:GNAT family N-acetyltransferase [Kribbella deserti]|uniref:GNAT family N-acetyltransferase n=1 Tax=Kribbella deserti TaxID=1926257 RepID=A0ABV6QKJ7_9ACTN
MEMTAAPPAGYTVRRPRPTDAADILEVVSAYNTRVVGYPDCTLDDIFDNMAEPGFDPETDGWLVHTEAGEAAGYAWVYGTSGADQVDIDVVADDPVLSRWLFTQATERGRVIARNSGHDHVVLDAGIYRGDQALRDLASGRGFSPSTTYHRMRVDHGAGTPEPRLPAGAVLRRGAHDEASRRTAYEVMTRSFADQEDVTVRPFKEWVEVREARPTFSWSQLSVLAVDGRPVAVCESNDQFVEDENCGYITRLGVLPGDRGKGYAKYLLSQTFAENAAAGLDGTILHVDTSNPTPALGLYLSVGMQPVLVIDVWRQVLSTN